MEGRTEETGQDRAVSVEVMVGGITGGYGTTVDVRSVGGVTVGVRIVGVVILGGVTGGLSW